MASRVAELPWRFTDSHLLLEGGGCAPWTAVAVSSKRLLCLCPHFPVSDAVSLQCADYWKWGACTQLQGAASSDSQPH